MKVDARRAIAHVDGLSVPLTSQELTVLRTLSTRAVSSREQLRRVLDLPPTSGRRVDGILVRLRRHLGARAIRTVRGRGWILEIPVEVIDEDDPVAL